MTPFQSSCWAGGAGWGKVEGSAAAGPSGVHSCLSPTDSQFCSLARFLESGKSRSTEISGGRSRRRWSQCLTGPSPRLWAAALQQGTASPSLAQK